MNQADAFLQAILDDPDDDVPRLVYADWLDDQGEHDRAEFIRTQLELARLPEDGDRTAELRAREETLLEFNRANWAAPLEPYAYVKAFRRGFPEAVSLRWRLRREEQD